MMIVHVHLIFVIEKPLIDVQHVDLDLVQHRPHRHQHHQQAEVHHQRHIHRQHRRQDHRQIPVINIHQNEHIDTNENNNERDRDRNDVHPPEHA